MDAMLGTAVRFSNLEARGFISIEYPPLVRARVAHSVDAWQRFCALPLKEKREFSGGTRVRDFGYMVRRDAGVHADDKELFHLSLRSLKKLLRAAKQGQGGNAYAFIEDSGALLEMLEPLVLSFAREMEEHYRLRGFEKEVRLSKENWVLRYLHYFPNAAALAHAHADRGGFTLHCYESCPGGEYLSRTGAWLPWPVSETETIIFPSAGLQYRSQGALKALWHRALPNEKTAEAGRYAVVAFIDFHMSYRFNDDRFRMQDFPPGFNYHCSFPEFARLFVPTC